MTHDEFPPPVRRNGLLGLLGAVVFLSSVVVLHLMSTDIDWMRHYVSNFANEPLGQLFVVGALAHGLGNLALALGLRGALPPGRLRSVAVLLFRLAAIGILLAALFPTDPLGEDPSVTGLVHRTVTGGTIVLELAAIFVFSAAFSADPRWRRRLPTSLALSASAAVALILFSLAFAADVAPGLAERGTLTTMMAWEIWAAFQLIRPA